MTRKEKEKENAAPPRAIKLSSLPGNRCEAWTSSSQDEQARMHASVVSNTYRLMNNSE